jgi:pantoate--beta-alanine ligase
VKEVDLLTDLDNPCAFVPTMGALHAGHQSLIRRACELADEVVVSIFVNPLQFENKEDLAKYPSTPKNDSELASEAGATILWRPSYPSIYPGELEKLSSGDIGRSFEGVHRPGHFDGVLTVVNRLFELSRPKYAIFGEKDFQQLFLIKEMAAKLHPEIQIIAAPTIRDNSGLALSSRNVRLSDQGLEGAQVISKVLSAASSESSLTSARQALKQIERQDSFILDYAEIIDEESFQVADESSIKTRVIIAGWIEGVRLIDNMAMQNSLVRA